MADKTKFGIIVAPKGKRVRRTGQNNRLNTDQQQFKYYKTVFLTRTIPTVTDSSPNWVNSVTFTYVHDLPYLPSFDTFLKGHKGTWGKILRGGQSINIGAYPEFPYTGTEYITSNSYNVTVTVYGGSTPGGIAAHDITLRLTLLYDEAFQ